MAKQRIAVLGGGIAALSTVFELTDRPDWQEHFDITVYQLGWRLGGKGASGRNMSGPPGTCGRIEEHGLHLWFGFYENAFGQMRRCYTALGRSAGTPLATIDDAFKPHSLVFTMERANAGWRSPWQIRLSTNDAKPGLGHPFPRPADYLKMLLQWIAEGWRQVQQALGDSLHDQVADPSDKPHWWGTLVAKLTGEKVAAAAGIPIALLLQQAVEASSKLAATSGKVGGPEVEVILGCLEHFLTHVRKNLEARLQEHDLARRGLLVVDIGGAVVRGLLKDNVFSQGFDQLNGLNFSEWLLKHDALPSTVDSAPLRATYDTVFGFRQGDPSKETLAAGVGLRSGLRMFFGYKGAFMWKMQAGMGDVVFAPLYEVLKRRGVKFEFFHRVTALRLSADKRSIASVQLRRQATLKKGMYEPLIEVKGLQCWPNEPLYDQLVEGQDLQHLKGQPGQNADLESFWTSWPGVGDIALEKGHDFDTVVLGIPIAVLPHICKELIDANKNWATMIATTETMRTLAVQLWFKDALPDLGWTVESADGPLLGAFQRPLSTWADMTHLIEHEDWPEDRCPGNLAYLCGPMPDSKDEPPFFSSPNFPNTQTAEVRRVTAEFLQQHAPTLWPKVAARMAQDGFAAGLAAPAAAPAGEALDCQFFRANIDPSERYCLSVPGSIDHRLRTDGTGFDNLYIVGDWIKNGLDAGCIEAAVMSGMQASRAIAKYPEKVVAEEDVWDLDL